MPELLPAGALAVCLMSTIAAQAETPSRLAGRFPGKVDTGRTIALEAEVACDAGRAYRLWSTREGAERFFAPRAEVGDLGGPYTMAFFPAEDPRGLSHGTAGARVLEAQPDRFFAFEWVVFAGDARKGAQAPPYAEPALRERQPLPTWVELEFTPAAGGARVKFRHFGFGEGDLYAQSQAWFARAWSGVLQQMKKACR
jgi:uncharacterized protein YndB with AHSA1/START domain